MLNNKKAVQIVATLRIGMSDVIVSLQI